MRSANPVDSSLALLTDLYELTMAYGYWKLGRSAQQAAFHLFFRTAPFQGAYAVAAGLEAALDFLAEFRFREDDLAYLAALRGNDGQPLFAREFLDELARFRFACDVDAVPEGTIVFGHEPLIRVCGPILQAQLAETALLNIVNFQTLIATKAARVVRAADGDPVIEFGLRRAQGVDGGLSASRAAYVGGCAGTSNVLAGKRYGIPVLGTHAHSWVMAFDDELEAFQAYARAMPNNCVFLVDTYDTLEGVRRAVQVGRQLRDAGHELAGIRLDSGDLAALSVAARQILDAGGFPRAAIVGSSDLDEQAIAELKQRGAAISVWGVGARLATAYDQPALGGVYKLGAVREKDGPWTPKLKLSAQAAKSTLPGVLQVRRFADDHGFTADLIYDALAGIDPRWTCVDLADAQRRGRLSPDASQCDLLRPVLRDGRPLPEAREPLDAIRARVREQLARFPESVVRLAAPEPYRVGLDAGLHERREALARRLRGAP